MIDGNLEEFHGLPVKDFKSPSSLADFSGIALRLRCEYDTAETIAGEIGKLLDEPGAKDVKALVLGLWCEDGEAVDATPREGIELLVSSKEKLPALEALFVGDIISEENEISWIQNADVSPIWSAFPKLTEFRVRGSNNLRLGKINHAALTILAVECGGLPAGVAREALDANAPIEHFELWFGDEQYGLTTEIAHLDDLFAGKLFPRLKRLGLRNCGFADEIAKRIATSPLLDRIEHLDMSLGTLRDEGAEALIASGRLGTLKSLDIHHHYLSDGVRERLAAATPNLIADDAATPDNWDGEDHYYVSVAE